MVLVVELLSALVVRPMGLLVLLWLQKY
jgi:hypothetical protein